MQPPPGGGAALIPTLVSCREFRFRARPCANSTLHRDLEVEPLPQFIKKRTQKTCEGAEDNANPLVRTALTYDHLWVGYGS